MKFRTTMGAAILITKFIVSPFSCWPLPPDAKSSDVRRHNLCWWLIFIHLIVSSFPSVYNIYLHLDSPDVAIRIATEFAALVSNGIKMVICKVEAPRLQGLLGEVQEFLEQATNEEMELIQFYVDKCLFCHGIYMVCSIVGPFAFIAGPAVTSQHLPANFAFPFSVEPFWIWATFYVSQSFLIIQVGAMAVLDFMYAILLWFAVARFEMVCLEFQSVTNVRDNKRCIRKHQELIEYTDGLSTTTRPMALHIFSMAVFAVTTGGFVLTLKLPFYEKVKFVFYECVAAIQLFLFTWPADNLMEMSEHIGRSVYYSAWIGKPEMLKDILIVAQRSQFPLHISINGLLPALSLELFGSAASVTFSYLTTLRAVIED